MSESMHRWQSSHVLRTPMPWDSVTAPADDEGDMASALQKSIHAAYERLRQEGQPTSPELDQEHEESRRLVHERKLWLLRVRMVDANALTRSLTAQILEAAGLW
jgi:hypothetical protein